jgi:hypothetical protein
MRRLLTLVVASLCVTLSHAATPVLLEQAWDHYVQDIDHWAFTETNRALDAKGNIVRETVTRFDPSLPYAEQFSVLKHTGKPSLEQMQKWARERGIERGQKLERPGGVENDAQPRVVLNGAPALADLEHASVMEEDAQSVTYRIPLHAEGGRAAMIDKFETVVRVDKARHAFSRVEVRLAQPLRVKLVAKVERLEFSIDFAPVDPQFGPVATVFKDHSSASVLFRKREGGHESVRTEFQRVKPYRDRFGVKIGASRTLDF